MGGDTPRHLAQESSTDVRGDAAHLTMAVPVGTTASSSTGGT